MSSSGDEEMLQDFHVIEAESRVAEALEILRSDPGRPVVVLDSGGRPASLLLREDEPLLATGGKGLVREILGDLPPMVVEPAGFTMGELVESAEFSAFAFGARGIVVLREGRPAGVVPVRQIDQFLAAGYRSSRLRGEESFSGPPSDAELPGTPSTPPIVMYCKPYGHRNELQYVDRRAKMECQIKHPQPHFLR